MSGRGRRYQEELPEESNKVEIRRMSHHLLGEKRGFQEMGTASANVLWQEEVSHRPKQKEQREPAVS